MLIFLRAEEPWQIAAARWCTSHSSGFKVEDLKKFIHENYDVKDGHVEYFFQQEIMHPSGRTSSRTHVDGTWTPPLNLVAKVTDYDELREARKNAFWAQVFAILSLIIASVTLLVTMFK